MSEETSYERLEEQRLSEETLKAASTNKLVVGILIPVFALLFGLMSSNAEREYEGVAFVFGAIGGALLPLLYFLWLRVYTLDLKRRHAYMDRT